MKPHSPLTCFSEPTFYPLWVNKRSAAFACLCLSVYVYVVYVSVCTCVCVCYAPVHACSFGFISTFAQLFQRWRPQQARVWWLSPVVECAQNYNICLCYPIIFCFYAYPILLLPPHSTTPVPHLFSCLHGLRYNTGFPPWDVATSTGNEPYDGNLVLLNSSLAICPPAPIFDPHYNLICKIAS